ncbi:MAG: phytoene/squalene synthase family protein [Trueperaceae bacterium]
MLRATSRTFALSIEQLPGVPRRCIAVAYLLLRVSDYIEDNEVMSATAKAELLRAWATVLERGGPVEALVAVLPAAGADDPEARLADQAGKLLGELRRLPEELQEIVVCYVTETTRGMARWQERGPFLLSEVDLDEYMHYVAGIVGHLITEVFAWHSPSIAKRQDDLMPLAHEYGLALQTVNVIRGLRSDFERGWVFVPDSLCAKEGLSQHELFQSERRAEAMQVVTNLARKAEGHLESGLRYVAALPRRHHQIRLACMWPLLFAARTLAVSRHDPAVLETEVKISRAQVREIVLRSRFLGWSNAWFEGYYWQLMKAPGS